MTTIYYFTATGNSLTTAQRLKDGLTDCRLIPVTSTRRQLKVIEASEAVGFVFPVYYGDMPCLVRELISKMVFKTNAYIFSVFTCRGHAGAAPQRMDQLLRTRGQKLSLAVNVLMPGNSYISSPEAAEMHLKNQNSAVAAILSRIAALEANDYFTADLIPLTPTAYPNNFRGINAEETCIGCGVCVQVCPMDNIRLIDGRAVIDNDCSTCLSCFHWCPVEAIWMSKQENIARRNKYHHPAVTLRDILSQKGSI